MMSKHKKSRTPPRARICRFRQEPDSETTEKRPAEMKAYCPCWYFFLGIKRIDIKLGGFTYTFDEITDEMSLETGSDGEKTASKQQFTPCQRKIKGRFRHFFVYLEL